MYDEIRSILHDGGSDGPLTATQIATMLHQAPERRSEILAVVNNADAATTERRDALRVLFTETRTQAPHETADEDQDHDSAQVLRRMWVEREHRGSAATVAALRPSAAQDRSEWRSLLPNGEEWRATQTTAVPQDGGYSVPTGVASEYVDLLRAKSAVARVLPASSIIRFATQNLVLPHIVGSTQPAKVAEATAYGKGGVTFAPIEFESAKLGEIRYASIELHDDSSLDIRRLLADDMLKSMAAKLDSLAANGNGATDGLTGLMVAGTTTALGAGVALDWDALSDAAAAIESANGTPTAVLVAPDVYAGLRVSRDEGGYVGDPTRSGSTTAWGLTMVPSSAVPSGTAIVLDGNRVFLGIRRDVRVTIDEHVGFENDTVGYKVSTRVAGLAIAEASSVQVVKAA